MRNCKGEEPERVLSEVIDYIVDGKKYQLYKNTDDLLPFF